MLRPVYKIMVFDQQYRSLFKAVGTIAGREVLRLNTLERILLVKEAGGVVHLRLYDLTKREWSTPEFSPI